MEVATFGRFWGQRENGWPSINHIPVIGPPKPGISQLHSLDLELVRLMTGIAEKTECILGCLVRPVHQ